MRLVWASYLVFCIVLLSSNSRAYSIQNGNKLTIIQFQPDDFPLSIYAEDSGRFGDFAFETAAFDLAAEYDSEIEIIWTFTGSWKGSFKNVCEFAKHHLGVLELNYEDRFGNSRFEPKVIRPNHVAAANCVDAEECTAITGDMRGGKTIVHGPLVIKAGARNIRVGLSDVAENTRFELKGVEVRVRPVK